MKNLYLNSIVKKLKHIVALLVIVLAISNTANAQVKKAFTQRTSQYTPTKKIYNVKGDFAMLGNTCLTPQNYTATTNNNSQTMIYVDTDSDANTFNSSSSTLVLSTEGGVAVPACSSIVYAGLYWTGKSSPNATFDVTRNIGTGTQTINNNLTVIHNQNISNTASPNYITNYALSVSRGGSTNDRYPQYSFNGNGNSYVFKFYNTIPSGGTSRVTLTINSGAETAVPVTINGSGTEATLATAYSITDGTLAIKIKKLTRLAGNNESSSNTQNNSTTDVNVSGSYTGPIIITKNFNKRIVSLKGPTASSYTQITAAATDIYYPSGTEDDIYSAYAEITDYVRNNGVLGQYTVADMALLEGDPGGTGYSGGWGMIVVYENSKMKWRDVTIFDGYAYVSSTNSSGYDLPVSGFNTVQAGNVGIKLGVMASEGDVNFTGDYFRIRNLATTNYTDLSHSGNVTTNFFNSSINTGGTRSPNLVNNTGVDIAVVDIPNTGNAIIGNSQTATNFKYGTSSDTYSIFAIAMSVDAYIPEPEAIITTTTINSIPAVQPYTVLPGQEIGFSIDVRNLGTEAISNYKVVLPIPYNTSYVLGSATGTIYYTTPNTTITGVYDSTLGATGSIVWNFGTLPLPAVSSTLLGRITFKLKATTDCSILNNASCASLIAINGNSTGVGTTTNVALNNSNLIQGYTQNGSCIGSPIPTPINIGINGTSYVSVNCPNTDVVRHFSYCSASTTVSTTEIASNFPIGSLFYNEFPVTINSIQYSDANPIPLVAGSTVTYYAVPAGGGGGCNFPFTISKCPAIVAQNDAIAGGNGTTGNPNIGNVLVNNGSGADTVNGNPATIAQVILTVTTPATSIGGNPVPVIAAATGQVSVPAGTPAGTYTIVYQICDVNSNTNCDPATVTITVTAPAIVAQNDSITGGNGTTGNTNAGNVLNNNGNGTDTLNGNPVTIAQVNLTVTTPAASIGGNPVPSIATATGQVSVPVGTPAGTYTIVYQICEKINPANCDPATVTITVTAPAIVAQNDTIAGGNGTTGNTNAGNVLSNNGNGADTLNSNPVTIAQVNLTITTPATPIGANPVPVISTATGQISIPTGTPAGTYTIVYQICEKLNTTNCDPATVTITVTAPAIVANDDAGSPVNGFTGGTAFTNVLVNDTLNGVPVLAAQVNTTFVSSTNAGITLSGTNVLVAPGTPAGPYTLTYQICEILNPSNCDTAVVTVNVTATAIVANDDAGSPVNGFTGGTAFTNVLVNDTLNGVPVLAAQVNTTFVSSTNAGITLSGTNVLVAPGTPAGPYTLTYQICEVLNPSNCDTAVVTVNVTATAIVANDDAGSPVNGFTGGTAFTNVLVNDTLNGVPVLAAQVNTTFVSSTNAGITLSGTNVLVAPGTPAGPYTLTYQICEVLNPSNCDTAVVTVNVTATAIVANDDAGSPVNGFTGGTAFTNVLVNDTLNGVPVLAAQVNTTFVSSTNAGITLSGTNVLVAPGTPAGPYTLTYQICEVLNPSNCDTAVVTVNVTATAIVANDDAGSPVNGFTGGTAFTNVLVNDTLNGVPVLAAQVNTTFVSSTNAGITLSGTNVLVAPGTPAGPYTLTYQICEVLNPSNCDTAVVTVNVTATAIVANDDAGSPVNGFTGGTAFTNVLVNDTLNGVPVLAAQVNTTFVSSTNAGITLSGTNVLVAPGTPAGPYTLTYQICEILNPSNCDTAVVTVNVTATAIVANDDAGSPVNGFTGGTAFTNVLVNDTLNGVPVLAAQVNTTFVSSTNAGITLSGTNVLVAPGTPAGPYTLTYQICEVLNPSNCDTAVVTVNVTATAIVANDDAGSPVNGFTGGTAFTNVLVNDTLNGVPVLAAQVNTTFVSSTNAGITLSGTNVLVAPGTPAGPYTLTYQICEVLNPSNCDTAVVTVNVTATAIVANDDAGSPVNGFTGGTAFTNVLVNDTLNGVPVLAAQVNTTFVSSTNAGITLSGTNVLVAPGTPAGPYTLTYQICEVLNPSNCDTAVVTVNVTATAIVANDDAGSPVNGFTGGTAFTNVLVNDTLNGVPVLAAQVNTTFVSSTNAGITLSGTNVLVAPGTPAGPYTLTYQICEILNPSNCDTAVVTVNVTATAIVANDDAGSPVNGFTGGTAFTNVLVNDTLNGVPVLAAQVSTTFVSSTNAGITLSGTNVLVAPGTPAGPYTLTYQICEILNPSNCDTAVVTVNVTATAIVANDDAGSPVNGFTGGTAFTNVLVNDTLNGVPVLAAQVNTTFVSSTNAGITLSGTNVLVAPGTPAGPYTLTYQICEVLNPSNCDTAVVTVNVTATAIVANDDAGSPVNGFTGGTAFTNVLVNDTLNGVPVLAAQVNTTFVSSTNAGITLSGTNVLVAPGTPAGPYTLTYQICEILNPSNCDTAVVTVTVIAPAIDAQDDTYTNIDCTSTGQIGNVLINDTLNNNLVSLATVNYELLSGSNPNISIDNSGNITVTNGIAAGTYTFTYKICEILNASNCDTATITIIVHDDTKPVIAQLPEPTIIDCPAAPVFEEAVATDTCGPANLTFIDTITPGTCTGSYIVIRTWTATDDSNNTATATQTITVQDITAPTWTTQIGSLNATVECSDAQALATAQGVFPTATDNCDSDVTNIVKTSGEFVASETCANAGSYTNTWTVTDACGNTSIAFTQIITVQDTTVPVWSTQIGSLNATVECSDAAALATAQGVFPTATDNCDSDVTNIVKTSGEFVASQTCANAGSYTNTWTVTDACGNTSIAFTQIITVQDTTVPVWSTQIGSLNATVECSDAAALATAQGVFPTATDNCDSDVTNIVKTSGEFVASETCANAGSYTNTWTVTDACGNTSVAFTQIITVQDTTVPVWSTQTGSLNATVECSDAQALATAQGVFPTATDNCDSDVTNIVKTSGEFVASETCANAGSYTNTWTVTDACGNTSIAFTQIITVQDTTVPVWSTQIGSLNATVECSDTAALATAQGVFPTATDNCDSDVTNIVKTSGQFVASETCANAGSYTNTWTVTDACGNTSVAFTQIITIQDTTKPQITTAATNLTAQCDGTGNTGALEQWLATNGGAVATDNCSDVTWSNNFNTIANDCSAAVTVIFTATDVCGNFETTTATFTIQDTTAPTWSTEIGSLNATVECSDAAALATAQGVFPAATDNCDSDVTNIVKNSGEFVASETCANAGSYTNTWTVTDACGNTSIAFTQIITVQDTTVPVWSTQIGSLNATVECSDTAALATAQGVFPTATDNCDSDVTNIVKTSGEFVASETCANAGSYTNTWTVTDACGNTSIAFTQVITVQDTTVPVWSTQIGSLNATVECSDAQALATAQGVFPTATDNCDSDVTNIIKTSGEFVASETCANAGSYTNTWTVTDACGNTSIAFTQIITVQDTTIPVWSTQIGSLNATVECSDTAALATAQGVFPTATDNCDSDVTNIVKTSGEFVASETCANAGSYTNTWTVTDACGNTSIAFTQVITVQDTTVPVWSTQIGSLNATVECSDAQALATAQGVFPTATDNCDSDVTNIIKTSGEFVASETCANAGSYTNTWTVTDACGNTSIAFTQIITVQDTTVPVWSTQIGSLNATVECSDAAALATAQGVFPTATDNCDSDVTNIIKTSGEFVASETCANAGSYTNTWTVTDACGNTSDVFTQVITVHDTTVPTWVTLAGALNTTVECSDAAALATAQGVFPTATDNCDSDVTNIVKTSGEFVASEGCTNGGSYTNTWTVTDACGNTSIAFTQVITVQDTTVPTWVTLAGALNTTVECSDAQGLADAQNSAPQATDNCSNVTYIKTAGTFVTDGTCPSNGTYTNTWIASDSCSNQTTVFTQVITVEDTTAPTWSTLADALNVTVECSDAQGLANAQNLAPLATDNCSAVTYVKTAGNFVAGTCPSGGTYTNTWRALDTCSNLSTVFTQIISVQDTTKPVLQTVLDTTIEVNCSEIPALPNLVFTDACSAVTTTAPTVTQSETENNVYTITRTWTATDACGNFTTVTQNVIVTTAAQMVAQVSAERCNTAQNDQVDLLTFLPQSVPSGGTLVNVDNASGLTGTVFNALGVTLGQYTFSYIYQTDASACPSKVDIIMNVNDLCTPLGCDTVLVHNAFTPNGDGLNEFFEIDNIAQECHLPNTVEIYNRWGVLVYETKDYDNNLRKFTGVSEGRSTVSKSADLPTGTYFYILQYSDGNGNTVTESKYLYLTR